QSDDERKCIKVIGMAKRLDDGSQGMSVRFSHVFIESRQRDRHEQQYWNPARCEYHKWHVPTKVNAETESERNAHDRRERKARHQRASCFASTVFGKYITDDRESHAAKDAAKRARSDSSGHQGLIRRC